MAINDLPWRKFPRDTIGNGKLTIASRGLPDNLRHAVFTVWVAFYCAADDIGTVDCTDVDVMSYNCMLNTDELALIINRLLARNLIYEVFPGESRGFYIISDWEEPNRPVRKDKTIAERRAWIAAQIDGTPYVPPSRKTQENTGDENPDDGDSAPISTKNEKTLHSRERDRERERCETGTDDGEEKRTHTHSASAKIKKQNEKPGDERETPGVQEGCSDDMAAGCGGTERDGEAGAGVDMNKFPAVLEFLEGFFSDYNQLGYTDTRKEAKALRRLSMLILKLSDKTRTPGVIASVLCDKFVELQSSSDFYSNMPITPSSLTNRNILQRVLSLSQRSLFSKSSSGKKWLDEINVLRKEIEEEEDGFRALYNEYGIAPDDPNRTVLLIKAMKNKGSEDDQD